MPLIPIKCLTVGAFLSLFLLVSLATTLFVRNNNVNALLKGSRKPKSEPKSSVLLVLLAAGCLSIGYGWALTYTYTDSSVYISLLAISLLIAIGSYFFTRN